MLLAVLRAERDLCWRHLGSLAVCPLRLNSHPCPLVYPPSVLSMPLARNAFVTLLSGSIPGSPGGRSAQAIFASARYCWRSLVGRPKYGSIGDPPGPISISGIGRPCGGCCSCHSRCLFSRSSSNSGLIQKRPASDLKCLPRAFARANRRLHP